MPQVQPANKTGLLYILVSNLPWSCTWQRLKDFAREDSKGNRFEVEHAEVYRESTCGWVTVRGEKDFQKAYEHLNGGYLDGRCLCASDRNMTEPISVRDLALPLAPYTYQPPATAPSTQQPSRSNEAIATFSTAYHSDRMVAQIEIPYTSPMYTNYPYTYATMAPVPGSIPTPTQPVAPQTFPAETMAIIKSKVIITSIPYTASSTDLRNFISSSILENGLDKSAPEDPLAAVRCVRIEKHQDGKQKSHAFIIFQTRHMAENIVHLLNGATFKGKALKAKLAKEGVVPDVRLGMKSGAGSSTSSSYRPPLQQGRQKRSQKPPTSHSSSKYSMKNRAEEKYGKQTWREGVTPGMADVVPVVSYATPAPTMAMSYGAEYGFESQQSGTVSYSAAYSYPPVYLEPPVYSYVAEPSIVPPQYAPEPAAAVETENVYRPPPDAPMVVDGSSPGKDF